MNLEKFIPVKKDLPVMVIEVEPDAALASCYRFSFDKADTSSVIVMKGKEKEVFSLRSVSIRLITVIKTHSKYNGKSYEKVTDREEQDESTLSYACVAQLRTKRGYVFGTFLLRKSLNAIAVQYANKVREMTIALDAAGQGELAAHLYLYLSFVPAFSLISVEKGSYLKVDSLEFDEVDRKEVTIAASVFAELDGEYQAAKKTLEYWKL